MAQFLFILSLFCILSRMFVQYTDVILLVFLSSQCIYVLGKASKQKNKVFLEHRQQRKGNNMLLCVKQHRGSMLMVLCVCYCIILMQYWYSLTWTRHTVVNTAEQESTSAVALQPEGKPHTTTMLLRNYDADTVARFIVDKTMRYADEDSAGLLSALLVGRKQYLSGALRDISRRAGASHLLALSGFHLNVLLYVLLRCKGKMPIFLHAGISLFVVWAYCLWLGFIPSLYRAAIMFTLSLLCSLVWGKIHFMSLWSMTSIIFLLGFTSALSNVGLVLSQLALIGVVYGRAMFPRRLDSYVPPVIIQTFSVGFGALIATAWYSFIVFKAVYPVALFSAIVLTPLVVFFILCGVLFLVLPNIVSLYLGVIVQGVGAVIRYSMSYASGVIAIESIEQLVLLYVLVCVLLLFTLYSNRDVKRKHGFIISGYYAHYSLQKTEH